MWDKFRRRVPVRVSPGRKWIIINAKRIILESGIHAKCWPFMLEQLWLLGCGIDALNSVP